MRMYGTSRATAFGYSLFEFEVYGAPFVVLSADDHMEGWFIYPNPSNGVISVELAEGVSTSSLEIVNISGQVVHEAILNSRNTILELGDLPNGMYLVTLTSSTHSSVRRLVLQR